MDKAKKKNPMRSDLLLTLGLLLLAGVIFLYQRLNRIPGAEVVVYVDGELTASYPLDENRELRLGDGEAGYNLLVIRDGAADVSDADCRDRVCVEAHPIRYDGESITCLPHRTVIRIEGGDGQLGVDIS